MPSPEEENERPASDAAWADGWKPVPGAPWMFQREDEDHQTEPDSPIVAAMRLRMRQILNDADEHPTGDPAIAKATGEQA